jgi:hypothetical protein
MREKVYKSNRISDTSILHHWNIHGKNTITKASLINGKTGNFCVAQNPEVFAWH